MNQENTDFNNFSENSPEQESTPALQGEVLIEQIPNVSILKKISLSPAALEKREIKKTARVCGITFLILYGLILLFSFLLRYAVNIFGYENPQIYYIFEDPAVLQVQQIIFSMLVFTLPFIVVYKLARYRISDLISFKLPTKKSFLPLFLLGLSVCGFADIAVDRSASIFQSFGIDYNVNFGENPEGLFGLLLTVISTVIMPALVEEFSCRGVVMGSLRKYGESFAIITSASVFGLMHGNFQQMPFAFFVGLILGFITVKSNSILIAMAVHAANNSISVIFTYFLNRLPTNVQTVCYVLLLAVLLLCGIIALVLLRDKDDIFKFNPPETESSEKKKLIWFFTSVPVIIYIVICLLESCMFFF